MKKGVSDEMGEVRVAKLATIVLGILSVILGFIFKGQNVAFMVGLAFSIAASANFPALLLSILWKRFTTQGAYMSIGTGTFVSLVLIVFSPTVWVDLLGNDKAIFPLKNPALVSMSAAFVVGIFVSLLKKEPRAAELFEEEKLRTYLGVDAE
jgi:cation/acetate symporter